MPANWKCWGVAHGAIESKALHKYPQQYLKYRGNPE